MELSASPLGIHRQYNQQLLGSTRQTATEMVHWLGAIQGQEYAQTKWGIGLRLPHLLDKDVEQELTEGKLLRTHLLRPTWHLVTADDIRWLLELTAPRVHQVNATMHRKLGLDNDIFTTTLKLIVKQLEGGRQLTRNELGEVFAQHGLEFSGMQLSYIMMYAELEGIVCSGVRRGRQNTYALLEERIGPVPATSREEALSELSRRYFCSRGPATAKDFSTWSGLTLSDCRNGIGMWSGELHKIELSGEDYYFFPGNDGRDTDFRQFQLLPLYDEFIFGYKDRSEVLSYHSGLTPTPAFKHMNLILFAGQICGTWRRDPGSKDIALETDFFEPLSREQTVLFEKAIQRYSEFKGLPVDWNSR
ncbi:MAG: winged helix DNA-binding domain-containing protein [Saprospiraceae bacterium]|nr:AlkZ family DNA glycosylase [Lewinella sp.]